jgi:HD superfamily phosphodiesterase
LVRHPEESLRPPGEPNGCDFDVFISHASEDSHQQTLALPRLSAQNRIEGKIDTRREAREARIRKNIDKNQQRLEKAEAALEKCEAHVEKLRDKIDSAKSESFKERAQGWLEEELERSAKIAEHIERIKGWIDEDNLKLSNLSLP